MRSAIVFTALALFSTAAFAADLGQKAARENQGPRTFQLTDRSWTPDFTFDNAQLSKWKNEKQPLVANAEPCLKMRVERFRRVNPNSDEVRFDSEKHCIVGGNFKIAPATKP